MSEISQIKKILVLSTFFTLGCVLVILSCSLYHNWLPLKSLLMFILAPMPNALFGHREDLLSETNETSADFAKFLTAILLVSAFALPIVFQQNELITFNAMSMSIAGGTLIYGTIITFGTIFANEEQI